MMQCLDERVLVLCVLREHRSAFNMFNDSHAVLVKPTECKKKCVLSR